MAQAGRNIWLLIALYFCYEICNGYLGIDGNAILESLVVIFYVACLIGFKFGEIPSSDKTQKAARNIFNILATWRGQQQGERVEAMVCWGDHQ